MLLRETFVRDLLVDELLRDHAVNLAAERQHAIGDHAHDPFRGAAVNEFDVPGHERFRHGVRRRRVTSVATGAGAAVDAKTLDTDSHVAERTFSTTSAMPGRASRSSSGVRPSSSCGKTSHSSVSRR